MGGRRVQIEVVLLHVLAVVAFGAGEAEEALLEDGVGLVPEGKGETEGALVVADAEQAVLAPAVGAGAGVVVGEGVPGVAALGVVLAHGAPLAVGEVGAPAPPGDAGVGLLQAGALGVGRRRVGRGVAGCDHGSPRGGSIEGLTRVTRRGGRTWERGRPRPQRRGGGIERRLINVA